MCNQKISIMDTGAMDMQLITSNDGEGSWFWFIFVAMVEGAIDPASYIPLAYFVVLFCAETVRIATWRDHPVPALWYQVIPMVTILNNNILLASVLQDLVAWMQKLFYMLTPVYGVYNHFFVTEGDILG